MNDFFLRDEDGKRYPNPSYLISAIGKDDAWNWLCTMASELFICEYQNSDMAYWVFRLGVDGYTMYIREDKRKCFVVRIEFFVDGDKECIYHVTDDVCPTIESLGFILLSCVRNYWMYFRGYIGYEFESVWNDETKTIEWEDIS